MARFTRDPTLKKWQDTTTASDTFNGDTAKDFIVGRSGDDIFSGGNGNDFIMGNKGADQLFGDSGGDVLLGGRGNDLLDGGTGADLLDGDYGTDTLTGGRQADRFEFHSRTAGLDSKNGPLAHDTITDFGDGNDVINLVAYEAGTDVVAVQNGVNNVLLYVDFGGTGSQDILIADIFGHDGALTAADVLAEVNFIA